MKDYSYREIGMLAGLAVGGVFAVAGYLASNNTLFLAITIIGVVAGIMIGRSLDRKYIQQSKGQTHCIRHKNDFT